MNGKKRLFEKGLTSVFVCGKIRINENIIITVIRLRQSHIVLMRVSAIVKKR